MPSNRFRKSRNASPDISSTHWAMLNDLEMPEGFDRWEVLSGISAELWRTFRDAVISEWIRDRPGSRPSSWWRFDAPHWPEEQHGWHGWYFSADLRLPRERLGGVGTPLHELQPLVPEFEFGIPSSDWGDDFDVNDSPIYESQAAYLRRLDLLTPGELKRIKKAQYLPEIVTIPMQTK